ncbi:MAG: DNA polymerase III subunit alpha, partial [Bacteroidota bacterium]
PDIDTDFDDEGRQKVIDYVVDKYGKQQVAQIVTYGTMAAKMSIKDVARVLDLPLDQSNALAKLVPDKPGISLKRVLTAPVHGDGSLSEKENLVTEDLENCKRLREYMENAGTLESTVLKEALILEGSVRGTGIHAAGIIIAPKELTEIIPVCTAKDSDLLVTQYEGSTIEDAGVIKMDFLGLKTLTIIRDALRMIEQNHGIKIDIDTIPLDDPKTYELYQRGETNGTFQFESAGMQKYLRELKPDKFDDLIAMNALYRPGPLEYIPNFIARKHGREAITYDLPEMEEYLKETLGISVYQEQIMLLAQKLAGFSKGDADVLRKAMGKKQKAVLDKMKGQFVAGAVAKGHPADKLEKIWTDWEAFASYAFNKSHSTCYAFVAYQTAYLKAHYPSEYMASVLTHSQGNIEKTTFFLEECKRMGLNVKGPDVNESMINFGVNKRGEIRYGMGSVKGVGEAAVESLIEERKKSGPFRDLFDFMRRCNLRTINKRVMENLVYAGAFDGFGLPRATFFTEDEKEVPFLERLLKYGSAWQEDKTMSANSLFGDLSDSVSIPEPTVPRATEWGLILKLQKEREVIGLYLSGHPLDDFRYEWENFATPLEKVDNYRGRKVNVAGFVTKAEHRISQKGTGWGRFTIQDYTGSLEITMFSESYAKFKTFFEEGTSVYVEGEFRQRYNSDEFEFKVNNVRLMETVGDEKTSSITLKIPVEVISRELLEKIGQLCSAHKGKHTLKIELIDRQNKEKLSFTSGARKVTVGNDFIAAMEMLGVECGVN